jgi:hypothetical protein
MFRLAAASIPGTALDAKQSLSTMEWRHSNSCMQEQSNWASCCEVVLSRCQTAATYKPAGTYRAHLASIPQPADSSAAA